MLVLILYSLLFTPVIYGSNSTLEKSGPVSNSTLNEELKQRNKTKVTVASEGGSIIPDGSPSLTLSTKKHMLNLDKEFGKNKEKPIVARKGVVYDSEDKNTSLITNSSQLNQLPKDNLNEMNNNDLRNKIIHMSENKNDLNKMSIDKSNSSTKINKPLVLVSDIRDNINEDVQDSDQMKTLPMKYLSATSVNKENRPSVHPINKHGHPGMIMPIVITILVVPMFAVLGYMAFRRGQEAWKNRHYKRMDFLLDGMYND